MKTAVLWIFSCIVVSAVVGIASAEDEDLGNSVLVGDLVRAAIGGIGMGMRGQETGLSEPHIRDITIYSLELVLYSTRFGILLEGFTGGAKEIIHKENGVEDRSANIQGFSTAFIFTFVAVKESGFLFVGAGAKILRINASSQFTSSNLYRLDEHDANFCGLIVKLGGLAGPIYSLSVTLSGDISWGYETGDASGRWRVYGSEDQWYTKIEKQRSVLTCAGISILFSF